MTSQMLSKAEKMAVEGMTLGQIRIERERVEGQILNLLQGFKKDTGLDVQSIEIASLETTIFGSSRKETVLTGVRLKLEDL